MIRRIGVSQGACRAGLVAFAGLVALVGLALVGSAAAADEPADGTAGEAEGSGAVEGPADDEPGTRGASVFANGRAILHKGGGSTTLAFPDVCTTPAPPASPTPVPYPNIGREVSELGPGRHKLEGGGELVVEKSPVKKVSGDEAGTLHVLSSKTAGKARFVPASTDVKLEGANVVRHLDVSARGDAGSRIVQLEDGTYCGVCMRRNRITAIYKLRPPARPLRSKPMPVRR